MENKSLIFNLLQKVLYLIDTALFPQIMTPELFEETALSVSTFSPSFLTTVLDILLLTFERLPDQIDQLSEIIHNSISPDELESVAHDIPSISQKTMQLFSFCT